MWQHIIPCNSPQTFYSNYIHLYIKKDTRPHVDKTWCFFLLKWYNFCLHDEMVKDVGTYIRNSWYLPCNLITINSWYSI